MADEADISDARAEIEDKLRRSVKLDLETPPGTGLCAWKECREPVNGPGRWCCVDCRDMDEKYGRR